ncbi:SIS domain-containing protein [Pararhodospirillum photometricum]|nr:SIS domain-containing protein [Pararhodospirillum photometricum]
MTSSPRSFEASLDHVRALFQRSIALKTEVLHDHAPVIVRMAGVCEEALAMGGKILLCGNGGSAADAQHLAAEFLVRLRSEVNRPGLAALALALDPSSLTACGNDYGFEGYFARMVETLGQPGDVLIGITTSGRSPNVVRALEIARRRGLHPLGLLGGTGQPALALCDEALVVPSSETGRVQEVHITAGHALVELVEDALLARRHITRL